MRRLAPLGSALCALALAVSPIAARAGDYPSHNKPMHVCPKCQMKLAMSEANGGAPVTIETGHMPVGAPCAACQASVGYVAPSPGGEAPGYASLGGPAPAGYAALGGRPFSTEPMPIGVVQAGYRPSAQPMPVAARGSIDPMHHNAASPTSGPMMAMPPYAQPRPASMGPDGPAPRPRIFTHLLGFEGWGDWSRDRTARRRSQHAAIPMGNPAQVPLTEVPASAIYGRR